MKRELDIAAGSGVRFFRMKGMEKYGHICFLWKGGNSEIEAQPNLVQIKGNQTEITSTKFKIV